MKLTNNEIYNYANALLQYFGADNKMKLPIKVSFFLQNKSEHSSYARLQFWRKPPLNACSLTH